MTFTDTVRFGLDEVAEPDVLFVGDWRQMILASQGNRSGERLDPGVVMQGDMAVMEEIGPAFAAAQGLATIPVEFPEL